MNFLAISGSARSGSINTALLRAISEVAPAGISVTVFDRIGELPVFSPDLEGERTPAPVAAFKQAISACDGLILASPEYVRTLPGGLKNAIDWLVSGEEIVGKPTVVAHASYRGDEMLSTLRRVLETVTSNFNEEIFLRIPVGRQPPMGIRAMVHAADGKVLAEAFLARFAEFCRACQAAEAEAGILI